MSHRSARPSTVRHSLTLLALAGALSACGADSPPPGGDGVDLQHVHAIAVDPDDPDRLLLGTHQGLASWTSSEGFRMVGDLRHDFMGFTVGPDGSFFASGHPAPGTDGPMSLGLITSDDAGESWEGVSLSGEADFHALDANAAGVYGYDAANQLLRVSRDGRAWTDLRAGAGFVDLAADPTSERLVGTTPDGTLVESLDAGSSFAAVADAPRLGYVDFDTKGTLVGVDAEGGVHRQSLDGRWSRADGPALGQVHAVAAGGPEVLWVLDDDSLRVSRDGAESFEEVESW